MASSQPPALVGSVFERNVSSPASSSFAPSSSKTGFPQVLHRSKKSAFARARESAYSTGERLQHVPAVVLSKPESSRKPTLESSEDDWRAQMSRDNEIRVSAMTDEEREEERREILEKFGLGIGDVFKKLREGRNKNASASAAESPRSALAQQPDELVNQKEDPVPHSSINDSLDEVPLDSFSRTKSPRLKLPLTPALSSAPSPSSTRPGSRASKTLRFAELTPDDVHVYESAPPSPRKKALALPAPSAGDSDTVSLGQWKGANMAVDPTNQPNIEPELEEGTPEYIRRRFFPSASARNPDLAWMEEPEPTSSSAVPAPAALRFDLSGNPLTASLHSSLPTHLGLHHHAPDADGVQRAGYTLDDVFMMSRSGVKAQRAAGMRMLVGVARWIGGVHRGEEDAVEGLMKTADIAELKKRIVAAGIDAMGERGSLGAHSIEVVWECVVGWAEGEEALDADVDSNLEGVELGPIDSALPLSHLLPQVVAALSTQSETFHSSSESASLALLLGILHRLARQTNDIATEIVSTPSLLPSIFRYFLLTDSFSSSVDSRLALNLLITLSSSTRANAQVSIQPADALLRFVTTLPPPDTELLTGTLNLYTALAAYGLYSHIASTAHLQFTAVGQYVREQNQDRSLMCAWAGLLEAWIVCATDPHQTTPDHDILWSQIVAWGWGQHVLELRECLGALPQDLDVWAALWKAEAAWLEGARINGVKSGESEREECLLAIKKGFEEDGGKENGVVKAALSTLASGLKDYGHGGASKLKGLGRCADTLASAIRLWLACLPPTSDGPLTAPPFTLPFPHLSDLCAKLVTHPIWSRLTTCGPGYVLFRPLASLLSTYLRLSKRMPDVSQDVWMAQALNILSRLLPGDEEFALEIAGDVLSLISPQWILSRGMNVPQSVWDKGGLSVIKPFVSGSIRPRQDVHIGPWCVSLHSIKIATTQRLPPHLSAFSRDYGLPLPKDWTLSPLDHLLRSGTSPVFNTLPSSWDASEVDVTRAALLFTKISRELSSRFSFIDFVLSREEAVFGCMKVFMLEHGQPHNDSTEEVYRDRFIEQLMVDLLTPFTIASVSSRSTLTPVIPSPPSQRDLEQVAVAFLGVSTPFYQYYTDFVALYDAISFSHPTFARLLLPPTSMRYAPDYRRHLWNDFSHVLKTIRTSPDEIISAELGEYMWPVETDAHMVGAYLRALLKVPLEGFVRLLAIHHVACSIWPDLRESLAESAPLGEDRAGKLLKAIVDQGSIEVVRDVLQYRQVREGPVTIPPKCFELDGQVKTGRLEYIRRVGGDELARRVEGVLQ